MRHFLVSDMFFFTFFTRRNDQYSIPHAQHGIRNGPHAIHFLYTGQCLYSKRSDKIVTTQTTKQHGINSPCNDNWWLQNHQTNEDIAKMRNSIGFFRSLYKTALNIFWQCRQKCRYQSCQNRYTDTVLLIFWLKYHILLRDNSFCIFTSLLIRLPYI